MHVNRVADHVVDLAPEKEDSEASVKAKNPAALALGRLGGLKGGAARSKVLRGVERSQILQGELRRLDGNATSSESPDSAAKLASFTSANDIIEDELKKHIARLEQQPEFNADVIAICAPIHYGLNDVVRQAIEALTPRRTRLAVVIETPGGYIEVAQRIVDTFRHYYDWVAFIVPNYAMSAGTVLVMSGDAIYMDYYSVLGPIDPQLMKGNQPIPALGYLHQYNRLIEKSKKGNLTTAEMAFLIEKFDPAELYSYEQARDLSILLLKEWLVKYKFKNWTATQTKGKKVTPAMRVKRAKEIASKLNDTEKWKSHGRGISMEVIRRDLNLLIEDFGANPDLNACIRDYYQLLKDYMARLGHSAVIHTKEKYLPIRVIYA